MHCLNIIFVGTLFVLSCLGELPDYIARCSLSDPKLNDCALESTRNALGRLVKGDKKYSLPRVEPIKVPEMSIKVGNTLKLKMKNVLVGGIGSSDVKKVNFDFDDNKVSTSFFVPNLNIQSRYVISGRILVVPIEGQGLVNITMSGVAFNYDFNFNLIDKDGERYVQIVEPLVTFKSASGYVDFGELFTGDSTLGIQVNQFLNDNWEEAEAEMGPDIARAISSIITAIAQQYFDKFSMTDMFLP